MGKGEKDGQSRFNKNKKVWVANAIALPLIYRDAIDNIRDLKRQQWTIAYYGLVVFAALIGLTTTKGWEEYGQEWPRGALAIIGLMVVGFGGWTLGKAQLSLVKSRDKMENAKLHFAEPSQRIADHRTKADRKGDGIEFPIMLAFSLVLGASILYWRVFPTHTVGCLLVYAALAAAVGYITLYLGKQPKKKQETNGGNTKQ